MYHLELFLQLTPDSTQIHHTSGTGFTHKSSVQNHKRKHPYIKTLLIKKVNEKIVIVFSFSYSTLVLFHTFFLIFSHFLQ